MVPQGQRHKRHGYNAATLIAGFLHFTASLQTAVHIGAGIARPRCLR